MREALKEAENAWKIHKEIPIGAIIAYQNEIIARSFNLKEKSNDPTSHAEINVIREASQKLGNWRLKQCILCVTIEPCLMCSGAILEARIPLVVFGAREKRTGAVFSSVNPFIEKAINEGTTVFVEGVCSEAALTLLQKCFKELRMEEKSE
jgi:tRNA(adenine34) deaminase